MFFEKILGQSGRTLPIMVDEITALECVARFSGVSVASLEECQTGSIPGVFLYEREPEKKHLSIKEIRSCIADLSEKPYEGRILTIIRDYDSATTEAMNASLKILEEPPEYAIILLVVSQSENVLETVRSRVLDHTRRGGSVFIDDEMKNSIEEFIGGNTLPLISHMSKVKIEKDTAISLLYALRKNANGNTLIKIERAIIDLSSINESARNIIDRVLLFWKKY